MMTDEDIFYQACAIPFRRSEDQVEFCLVTSTKTNEWSFPKGTIKEGETAEDTALKNARKEVGLHGQIAGNLGNYRYRKWETTLEVTAFLMEVERCDRQWEESAKRQRRWVGLQEAQSLVTRHELKSLLETAYSRIV